jgi:hypothetical protein
VTVHPRHDIDRCLTEGLSPEAETELRSHVRACESCRSYYDEQVILLRALGGDLETPTQQETDRMVRLALAGAGLKRSVQESEPRPGLLERLVWVPAPAAVAVAAAAAVLVVLGAAVSAWFFLSPSAGRQIAPVAAARVSKARRLVVDGVRVHPKAVRGRTVFAGQKIKVGRGGIATLSLERGGRVRVYPGSTLSLAGSGERVDLDQGKVWCLVKAGARPFAVRTDIAEAIVVGTSFVVDRRESGETEVRVISGAVNVRNVRKKKAVRVRSGRKTRVAPDRAPGSPRRYNSTRDRSDWDKVLRSLGRDINRAVEKAKDLLRSTH